ncbi:hypothetical protein CAPTEDRAFT_120877, partial [Capitella teleta]
QLISFSAFTGFETNNKYSIKNSLRQNIFFAAEETHCCTRYFCGNNRPFDMHIMDNTGKEVLLVTAPLRCDSCCFPCCLKNLEVQAPPGNVINVIFEHSSGILLVFMF